MHYPVLTGILLGAAVLLANLCAIAVLVMRDAYQRLQFATPVVSVSAFLIAVAVWLEDADPQARIKVILIGLILFGTNAVLGHVTARAIRIRAFNQWSPKENEKITLVDLDGKPK